MSSPSQNTVGNNGTIIQVKEFYIFNPTFGNDHDDEIGKILYYYPADTHVDKQLKHVGLCEAIIRFSENFDCRTPCEALHTQKSRYVFYQPEPNYWFTLVLSIPTMVRLSPGPDKFEVIDYHDDQVQNSVFQAVLLRLYGKFILRQNTLDSIRKLQGIDFLKEELTKSFNANLSKIDANQCGVVDIFRGLEFFPVERQTFLPVQCFINMLQLRFQEIKYVLLMETEKIVWTGIGQENIQVLYDYLVKELLSQHLLGGLERDCTFGFVIKKKSHVSLLEPPEIMDSQQHSPYENGSTPENGDQESLDSFVTASQNSEPSTRPESRATVTSDPHSRSRKRFHLLTYKAEHSYLSMFISDTIGLDLSFMAELESFLTLNFCLVAKQLRTSSKTGGIPNYSNSIVGLATTAFQILPSLDSIPSNIKFLYFNNLNMAVKVSPGAQCEEDAYRAVADLKEDVSEFTDNGEVVVKLATEPSSWIVGKVSNGREFYAIFNTKTTNSLTDIDEEIRKLSETHLNNIFFQD